MDDTLDLSRLDAGRLGLEFSEFDLVELVMSVARSQATQAQRKDLSLEVRVAESVPQVVRPFAPVFLQLNPLLCSASPLCSRLTFACVF